MKNSTLNDLLMINMQSDDIENFDPDKAIQSWMVGCHLCTCVNNNYLLFIKLEKKNKRDLTQSYDKSPYPTKVSKRQSDISTKRLLIIT